MRQLDAMLTPLLPLGLPLPLLPVLLLPCCSMLLILCALPPLSSLQLPRYRRP